MKKSIIKAYVVLVMVFWLAADATVMAVPAGTADRICAVTMAKPGKVHISKTYVVIRKGKKLRLYAWTDGTKGGKATWTSNRPNIASVNEKTGLVTAKRVGTARITAKINGQPVSCTVVVKP